MKHAADSYWLPRWLKSSASPAWALIAAAWAVLLGLAVVTFEWKAILAIVGLIAAVLIVGNVEFGLYAFLFITQVLVAKGTKPAFVLLVGGWILFLLTHRPVWRRIPYGVLMILISLWMLLTSAILNPALSRSPTFAEDLAKIVAPVTVFFVMATFYRTRQQFARFLNFVAVMGIALGFVGLIQLYFQIPIFRMFVVDPGSVVKAGGATGDPVVYGAQMVFCLCLTFSWYMSQRDPGKRRLLLVALVLIAFALLGSLNRSALLGLVGYGAVMGLMNRKTFIKVALVMAIGLILLAQTPASHVFTKQIQTTWSHLTGSQTLMPSGSVDTFTPRMEVLKAGYDYVKHNPRVLFFGAGISQFQYTIRPYVTSDLAIKSTQNATAPIVFLVELGLVGLILFVILVAKVLRDLLAMLRHARATGNAEELYLTQGILGAYAAFFVISLANSVWFMLLFWMLFAITLLVRRFWMETDGDIVQNEAKGIIPRDEHQRPASEKLPGHPYADRAGDLSPGSAGRCAPG